MTIPTPTYAAARTAYHEQVQSMIRATLAEVGRITLSIWPDATTLATLGELNEEWAMRIHPERVLCGSRVLAGQDDPSTDAETWDRFCDELEEPLMYLGDLTGDDYEGDSDIEVAEATTVCKNCTHVIEFRDGCWQDEDGYACPAITSGPDEHQPITDSETTS